MPMEIDIRDLAALLNPYKFAAGEQVVFALRGLIEPRHTNGFFVSLSRVFHL
jgi:hypothetical protein